MRCWRKRGRGSGWCLRAGRSHPGATACPTRPEVGRALQPARMWARPDQRGCRGLYDVTSAVYQGTCNLCGLIEEEADYIGETGSSAYHRCLKHEEEVKTGTRQCLCKAFGSILSRGPGGTLVTLPSKYCQHLGSPFQDRKQGL